MSRTLSLLAAFFALSAAAIAAGDGALDRATLRGIPALNIVVDQLDVQLQKAGITADTLRARLEDRLRAANIPIDTSRPEFLGVRVLEVRGGRGPYGVAINLGLYQPVVLARDAKVRTATQTWEVRTVLLAEPKQLYRAVMDSVDELANGFIQAWHSVNGK